MCCGWSTVAQVDPWPTPWPVAHAIPRENTMDDDIEWLSTADAADRLGINTRTLYRLIDAGEIPAYKFGRVIRVQGKDVEAFVEGARVKPGSLEHLYTT